MGKTTVDMLGKLSDQLLKRQVRILKTAESLPMACKIRAKEEARGIQYALDAIRREKIFDF